MSGTAIDLHLPDLHKTEEAIAFGRSMTREQYIFIQGARAALMQWFHQLSDLQERAFIAVDIQLFREALDAAPPEAKS